ncbi:MAG: 3-oxoacyl-[acyl-carrier-protein] reductase [Thermodesulfovibrionales bacterium]|nr:3-oxoacyl-[acyl-carrier-protein] reductase [Thermodesulfovibrionales bacterium]
MKGQVAIVTGGGRGIGKAISIALAKRGVNVVVVGTNLETASETASNLQNIGVKSIAVQADVAKHADVKNIFDSTLSEFGKVDILVNNAGITRDSLIIRMKDEEWDRVIDVNLKGTFLCSREAVKAMLKQKYGRIINISSIVGFMGNIGQANYSASKAGIIGLTKTIAKEYANRGITVNAIAPGFITTSMTESIPENIKNEMLRSIPMGRFGTTDDVAHAVVFLASPEAGYITGQVLHVNGGMYM